MSDTIIRVESLGKKYSIRHEKGEKYVALRDVFVNTAGHLKQRLMFHSQADSERREDFWALQDVSFEINRGDRVGIIGRNGAGKSTLLKILSRITEPTTGFVEMRGRVASLLEVGTGFHPELTGKENIFLNGAILGMGRDEIRQKFDEIVAFAEVERFLDTPVKRYSSGMYVRLAFSVAAHLEPDTLVVDEVLAVGDAQFQKKCLGKMEEVGKSGKTVLFVSHNMGAILQLTNSCLLLDKGRQEDFGLTKDIVSRYLNSNQNKSHDNYYKKPPIDFDESKPIEFSTVSVNKKTDNLLDVSINYIVRKDIHSVIAVKITNALGIVLTTVRDTDYDPTLFNKKPGLYNARFELATNNFMHGNYFVSLSFADMVSKRYDLLDNTLSFDIEVNPDKATPGWTRDGVIFEKTAWKISNGFNPVTA